MGAFESANEEKSSTGGGRSSGCAEGGGSLSMSNEGGGDEGGIVRGGVGMYLPFPLSLTTDGISLVSDVEAREIGWV